MNFFFPKLFSHILKHFLSKVLFLNKFFIPKKIVLPFISTGQKSTRKITFHILQNVSLKLYKENLTTFRTSN